MAKILIVDDSGLARRILRSILESASHQVIEASEGVTALKQYYSEKPDLVVLDLTMDKMSGHEVLAKLIEMDERARVIIASADIQRLTREEVLSKGASAFLYKPLVAKEILHTVQAVLDGGER
ncbi:MAG: response regulator [Nitrospirota bacterium]